MEEIDLRELFTILLQKFWIIMLATLLAGSIAFGVTRLLIKPQYTSSIKMYVNNSTAVKDDITSGDIQAAQSLVDTYITIIQSETVLTDIIQTASSVYSTDQLDKRISARSLNNTEVFEVSVTTGDPQEAFNLANAVADVSPQYLADIVSGTSVKIIDRAKFSATPTSPNTVSNTLIGLVAGFMLSCGIIILLSLADTRIQSEADLAKVTDLPVLGAITEFGSTSQAGYGYRTRSEVI